MYSPVKGARVSSRYQGGFRSTGGHSGIDFAAPSGSRIYAAMAGIVISVGNGGAYGNLTKIQHADGTIGYYAHQSKFAVKRGQRIGAGSLVGYVGSTGNSTGPHLHFEIRQNGKPVDPSAWLQGGGKRSGGGLKDLGKGTGSMSGGDVQMPDIVQYTNPNDVLAQLEAQGQAVAPGTKAGGGFDTPALDHARAKNLPVPEELVREEPAMAPMPYHGQINRIPEMAPMGISQGSHSQGGGAQGDFDKLMGAIKGKESGGNYNARNGHSGALGAYQIMPGNIASWSKAALGYSISPSQFANSPQLQDQIARHRMNIYFQKYGAAGAALAWYAGEGALKYSSSARNRKQGQYPSMNSYVQDILRRAGL